MSSQFKINDRVKVVPCPQGRSASGHNYKVGTTYKIVQFNSDSCAQLMLEDSGWRGGWIYLWELDQPIRTLTDLEVALENEQENLKKQYLLIEELQSKIDYTKKSNSKEFNEREWKVTRALTFFDNKDLPESERVKMITKLIYES